ncbi:MAG: PilT/PilU family type 4a pilus ATPase [Lachnospiraceae bacterium]|nr:PilT/PilU family type 4a pilus ATPase [Lachnospiraceae bacterium]
MIESTEAILKKAVDMNASDIFMIPGMPVSLKINGDIHPIDDEKIFPDVMDKLIEEIYVLSGNRNVSPVRTEGDDDFSFSLRGLARFRASVMKQRGSLAAIIRVVRFELPKPDVLGIPQGVLNIASLKKGLVLVTGAAGSGKSTTLACVIDKINHERSDHIITLEDPIEYLHRHDKSVVTQREIGQDTENYVSGLRAALRQAPDVILLGEMRDYETIRIALTAAETGHLVISTLHTVGAANTIDRIVDVFPANAQQQIRVQLSMVLQAVISQQLLTTTSGTLTPAFEIMYLNNAIRNMIRENKIHQIDNVISTSMSEGMVSMNNSLLKLLREGKIDKQTCINFSSDPEQMRMRLG